VGEISRFNFAPEKSAPVNVGDRPGDLPFELPARYELIVNLKAAKAIGLTIPDSFVLLADEVIE
jgi:ABC-type uncharacterized transport system substrate-binding protein